MDITKFVAVWFV